MGSQKKARPGQCDRSGDQTPDFAALVIFFNVHRSRSWIEYERELSNRVTKGFRSWILVNHMGDFRFPVHGG
jgi:hypothetical protein